MTDPTSSDTEFVLAASDATPEVVRTELRRWLDRLGWPADQADQIVFCVSEVVTNIIEHAYRDLGERRTDRWVQVSARREGVRDPGLSRRLHWVCIDVHDDGRWREPDPLRRGLGLLLLRHLVGDVVVTRGTPDYGTTVSLRSHPVELGPAGRR